MRQARSWMCPVLAAVCLAVCLPAVGRAGPPAASQPADAKALLARMTEAYAKVKTYGAALEYRIVAREGRWTQTTGGNIHLAFDRDKQKLVIDRPDFKVVTDGVKLRLVSEQLSGKHLEVDQPRELSGSGLAARVSDLAHPWPVDLQFLLPNDPVMYVIREGGAKLAAETDAAGRPVLDVDLGEAGRLRYVLDPKTHLVAHSRQTVRDESGNELAMEFDVTVTSHNQALPDKTFVLDVSRSRGFASLDELFSPDAGAPLIPVADGHPLLGKAAPALKLDTLEGRKFDLGEDKSPIIVLDFGATWPKPCREWLPALQSLRDGAARDKSPIAFYCVNLEEKPDKVRKYWEEQKLSLPVLLDAESKASQDFLVTILPQTVVIHRGKVVAIKTQLKPADAEAFRKELQALVAEETAGKAP